jgi:hypothetical protein
MALNTTPDYGPFNVGAKTRQVVDHHYDDEKPGKPLYLMIPGGIIALVSLGLIIFLGYLVWIQGTLSQNDGTLLIALLAPFYVGGVFLFSYGYELYDGVKALRLTAIIVFITVAAVVIVAVLVVAVFAMGEQSSGSSNSSRSRRSSGGGAGGIGYGGFTPLVVGGFGGLGSPTQTVTREVVREVPVAPPKPEPIQCPYCGSSYIPEDTHFTCPNCGAATPQEMLPPDRIRNANAPN